METNIQEGRLPVLTPAEVGYEAEDEDEAEDEVEVEDGSSTRSPSGANSSGAWVEQCDTWYTDYYTWCFNGPAARVGDNCVRQRVRPAGT